MSERISGAVSAILADVRVRGDAAVALYASKFDGATLTSAEFRVAPRELAAAYRRLPEKSRCALAGSGQGLDRGLQPPRAAQGLEGPQCPGRRSGERSSTPSGGLPGFTCRGAGASSLNFVLMTQPRSSRGLPVCPEIAVFTPSKYAGGAVAPGLLAALHLAGVEEVYRVGGARHRGDGLWHGHDPAGGQDFGPGNAYVCEAKRPGLRRGRHRSRCPARAR